LLPEKFTICRLPADVALPAVGCSRNAHVPYPHG